VEPVTLGGTSVRGNLMVGVSGHLEAAFALGAVAAAL
jgi:hypothetical protein